MVRVMNLITDDIFTLIETSTVLIDEDQYLEFPVRFTPDMVNGHHYHDFVLRVNGFDETMCCRLYGTGDTVELLKVSLNSTPEKRCRPMSFDMFPTCPLMFSFSVANDGDASTFAAVMAVDDFGNVVPDVNVQPSEFITHPNEHEKITVTVHPEALHNLNQRARNRASKPRKG
uniref:Cadherin domain-containing protein n=1 Tax=Panagrellus redivivus TaxID=6233 RepID=A0A7E4ZTG9_PANRE